MCVWCVKNHTKVGFYSIHLLNSGTFFRAQKLRVDCGDKKFKTSEKCFQMQGHNEGTIIHLSSPNFTFFLSVSLSFFLSWCEVCFSIRVKFRVHLLCAHFCYLFVCSLRTICRPLSFHLVLRSASGRPFICLPEVCVLATEKHKGLFSMHACIDTSLMCKTFWNTVFFFRESDPIATFFNEGLLGNYWCWLLWYGKCDGGWM